MQFRLQSDYKPSGDQPQAIKTLVDGVEKKHKHQVLLGITGSGKTFSMANVVQQLKRPTLVIAHRLSTIIRADKIILINRGEISDFGTHSQLLKSSTTSSSFIHILSFV